MKTNILIISMALSLVLLTGCGKDNQKGEDNEGIITPTIQPTVTVPVEEPLEEDETDATDDTSNETFSVQDYVPFHSDTEFVYEGTGNEYASYVMYTDFVDLENNRVQTRTNNGGTETIRVIERKDGKVTVVSIINECYYRDNSMDRATSKAEEEVLLMEPLVKGTQWTLSDGRKRYISATDVKVETPLGSYQTLEVTTESADSNSKDYYAPEIGLVKSIFQSGDMEVSSSLSEMNAETPFTQLFDVFYPASDEKIYVEPVTLTFHTNDVTRLIMQESLKKEVAKDTYLPLISTNTKINSLYLGEDNIVYVDFSAELTKEMNAGAGYETLILQSITNTLGNYYGVQKVYITIDNKPYESGHVVMKKGETFQVNMDLVVK